MTKKPVWRHLPIGETLDVSRGVIAITDESGARNHLDSCTRCREKVDTWKSFTAIAQRLREVDPPEEIVDRAKALGQGRPRVTALTRLKAALSYDSAFVPLPAGVRGASMPDQVVYQAEEFAVELRVSRERSREMVIVGQITNVEQPTRRLADVPVTLLAGDRVVVRARSNARGEFHLEHDERDRMRIEVAPEEGRIVRIPLRPKPRKSSGV
jgi:hypothetical protein